MQNEPSVSRIHEDSTQGADRHRLQFRLVHLLVAPIGIAIGLGFAAWLGYACLPILMLCFGPMVTLIVLKRTEGDSPSHAVMLGAAVQSLLFAIVLFAIEFSPTLNSTAITFEILDGLRLSILGGLAAGVVSILVSCVFVALWYAGRAIGGLAPKRTGTGATPESRVQNQR